MGDRINRAVELLSQDQMIYYTGAHTGHVLTFEQGQEDAGTWADYINVGMEHGSFDMTGLANYMKGLVAGGPTRSGHRTPAVIVEVPVDGTNEAVIRANAWQFRQILARGVHGLLLCMVQSADAVRTFVEECRYPINRQGVTYGLEEGRRGVGSEATATEIWGCSREEYLDKADPWPLNPEGELLLGLKIENVRGVSVTEQCLKVPGIGFAEMGPGDLSMSLGYKVRPNPLPKEMVEARDRVKNACKENGIAFLSGCTEETIKERIDEGVRIASSGKEEVAKIGREYSKREMPV
jgi:4-hydroxy-2-oxoheptanedioate aldolase